MKLRRLISPIESFLKLEAAGGLLLVFAATAAFLFANSNHSPLYFQIVNLPVTFGTDTYNISKSLGFWINDGLMVLFFFVVGLEIKRELVVGELNSINKAAFPTIAAIGGAFVPAVIYYALNRHEPTFLRGWGIPMATDIAFAVGVLTLFGKRIPLPTKVFLLALAIVDDLIAVLVIAVFYTEKVSFVALGAALVIFLLTHALKRSRFTNYGVYFFLGIAAWIAVFSSGVHATIAGVILGLMTPLTVPGKERKPLHELEHFLHPWVAFLIMPIFAFFNAGVTIDWSNIGSAFQHPVTVGVALGLIVGKPIGIFSSTLIAKNLGWITLPTGVSYAQILGIGFLGGIGFTMSLFIGGLSFADPTAMDYAKVGILFASIVAALLGSVNIYFATRRNSDILKP